MFGDVVLLGQEILTIDNKNRIFIPAYTNREEGEKLVLIYDKDLDIYKIYSSHKFEMIIHELNKKILSATNKNDEIYYKKKLLEISKSILKCSKIDSQGRMLIGKIFEGENKVLSIGCQDHLMIQSNRKK